MNEHAHPTKTVADSGAPLPGEASIPALPSSVELHTDFGDYELVEELGRGAMGVVYKARQKDLDRLVAIKVILTGRLATDLQVQRFHAEARAAAKLQHPNVVHIYEAGEVRGNHFFAMEYVAGQSLADVMQTKRLDFEQTAELISAVARAVDHLHSHDIVHRDLKPSNILLDKRQRPFVTDFGLAMMLERTESADKSIPVAGTPNYMAPEQAAGIGALIGPRTDVYCLGAVLYHMLTQRPPVQGTSIVDALVQVMESEPPRPRQLNPQIPVELEMICLRCLEKKPSDRYPSAAALADDLDRFLRGEAVESRPLGLWHWLRSWARRQPGLVARLAGFAACLVISHLNYELSGTEPLAQHLQVNLAIIVWAVASTVCQWFVDRERWAGAARWAWAAVDVIATTTLLLILDAVNSALVASYAVAIVGAGLWVRERIVWLVTWMSVAGYAALLVDGYRRGLPMPSAHWHLIVLTLMIVLGWIVTYQVHRIRKLGRYYKR